MTVAAADSPPGGRLRTAAERSPMAVVSFGVVMFSTGPVIVASSSLSGPVFSFWRLWCGVAVLAVAAALHRRLTGAGPTPRGLRWAAWCGIAFGLHQLLFMTALKQTSVVDVTLMNTLAPIVVAVLAVPLFGERPGVGFRVWSLVAIAGAAAVAVLGSSGPDGNPVGMALAAGNVVFYSLYFVGSKQARDGIDTIPFLFTSVLLAAGVVTGYVILMGEPVGTVERGDLVAVVAVAVLPGIVGHFSVTWPLRWVPANIPPVLMLTIPALSGALAWGFLGQRVELSVALAGMVTLAGVAGAVLSGRGLAAESLELAEET